VILLLAFGVGGLGLAAWHYLSISRFERSDDKDPAPLLKMRKFIGAVILVAGLVLLALGLLLAFWYKLAAFGEAVGLGLFALVAIGAARKLLTGPTPEDSHPLLDSLRSRQGPLGITFLLVGATLLIGTLGLIFLRSPGWGWFPELATLIFLGLLSLSCG